jgi:hypothetical protein
MIVKGGFDKSKFQIYCANELYLIYNYYVIKIQTHIRRIIARNIFNFKKEKFDNFIEV